MLAITTIIVAAVGLAVGLLVYIWLDERNKHKERTRQHQRYWDRHFVVQDSRTRGA